MQKNPGELSGDDRLIYPRWTIGFSLLYAVVFITFTSLVMMHPPITDDVVAQVEGQVEGRSVTGPVTLASRKADPR